MKSVGEMRRSNARADDELSGRLRASSIGGWTFVMLRCPGGVVWGSEGEGEVEVADEEFCSLSHAASGAASLWTRRRRS